MPFALSCSSASYHAACPSQPAGMRTRQPRSLLVGLMWMDPQRNDPLGNIRCVEGEG